MAKKILIIEDDEFLQKVINKKLSKEGYLVINAIDGEKGLKDIREEKPDLVLLDIILPEIDGCEVLTEIKKDQELSKIPIIILSNLGSKEEIEKGLKLGADDYLIKAHFNPEEIVGRVEAVFSRSKKD